MPKAGEPFEKLAQKVFGLLKNQDAVHTVKIEHDKQLTGESGEEYQIDVYWEYEVGGFREEVIVSARDWASHVKREHINALNDIRNDLPTKPRAVCISRTGFQKGALAYAEHVGIDLYELRDATPEDKKEVERLVQLTVAYVPKPEQLALILDNDWNRAEAIRIGIRDDEEFVAQFRGNSDQLYFVDENGQPIETLHKALTRMIPLELREVSSTESHYEFPQPTFIPTSHPTMPRIKVKAVTMRFSITKHVGPVEKDLGDLPILILKNSISGSIVVFNQVVRTGA